MKRLSNVFSVKVIFTSIIILMVAVFALSPINKAYAQLETLGFGAELDTSYVKPTNPGTIVENFDNNQFNANLWCSEAKIDAKSPSFVHVENGYLKISNAHKPHFTSMYQYGNLSLEFELFDYACYTEDEDGNPIEYSSEALTVYFGVASCTEDIYASIIRANSLKVNIGGTTTAAARDVTEVCKRVSMSCSGESKAATLTTVNPCDKVLANGRRTNVKIEVVERLAKLWMKYDDDLSYGEPILEMTLPNQPTGYVRFGSYGDTQVSDNGWERTLLPNYSIDSIKLENLDANPNICDMPEFRSNIYHTGSDWPYVDKDNDSDLLENRVEQPIKMQEDGCLGSIAQPTILVLSTIACLTAVLVIRRVNRNEEK